MSEPRAVYVIRINDALMLSVIRPGELLGTEHWQHAMQFQEPEIAEKQIVGIGELGGDIRELRVGFLIPGFTAVMDCSTKRGADYYG